MALEVTKQATPTAFAQGGGRGNPKNNNRIHEESKRLAREWFESQGKKSKFKETYE